MVIKLRLKPPNIITAGIKGIGVEPSPHGGTGTVVVESADMLWLGDTHFWAERICFQSAEIQSIETRSSFDEDDEPWELVYDREEGWSYNGDHQIERLLSELGIRQ